MKFLYLKYIPLVLLCFAVFIYFVRRSETNYFAWVKKYWFFKRSKSSRLSSLFYFLSLFILSLALLDFRGPESKIKGDIPDQRTIIIIDSSASMLVEDVRPSRFRKSLILARHFIKNAVGHQIAIVLFSDTHVRLVPFTDDIDLLDARVDALADTDIRYGGSNISMAVKESLQYFRETDQKAENVQGNILVFTDSEENDAGIDLNVPDGVNLAVVGVGTVQGGRIPLRDRNGNFQGYKKYRGEEVVSKFDENALKTWGEKVKSFKYWVALSYSVPTEEIVSFFRRLHKKKIGQGDIRVRPVFARYLLIPFIIFYTLSVFFRSRRSFSTLAILFIFLGYSNNLKAQEEEEAVLTPQQIEAMKEKEKIENEIQADLEDLKDLRLSHSRKLKLAENFMLLDQNERSLTLYDETIENIENEDNAVLFNYATALLKNDKLKRAIRTFKHVKRQVENSSDEQDKAMLQAINKNILLALKKQKQKEKDKKKKEQEDKKNKDKNQKKEENQDKKDNKEEDQKDQEQQKQGQGEQDDKQKDQKNNQQKDQDKKKGKDGKPKQQKKEEKKQDGKEDEEKKKKEEQKKKQDLKEMSLEEKEEMIRKKRKMVKIPAMLKQLLNNDRSIQKRKQKTSSKNRRNGPKKDW